MATTHLRPVCDHGGGTDLGPRHYLRPPASTDRPHDLAGVLIAPAKDDDSDVTACDSARYVEEIVPSGIPPIRWPRDKAEPAALPEPQVRAVVVELVDPRVPAGARAFAKTAIVQGWIVRATYARGSLASTVEGRSRVVDSVMIACIKPGLRVAAHWIDGKADHCGHVIAGRGTLLKITEGRRLLASADGTE